MPAGLSSFGVNSARCKRERFKRSIYLSYLPLSATPIIGLLVLGVLGRSALADSNGHDIARLALEQGEIMPFEQILGSLESNMTARIVSVEIQRSGSAWDYDLRVLEEDGKIRRVSVDAKSGQIRKVEKD
jgi:uncharacterized membrane protein YkoI